MDAKHTPGPWFQHHSDLSVRVCDGAHEAEDGCKQIAEAEIIGYDREVSVANARLIAAAPELLAALEYLRFTTQEGWITPEDKPTDWQLAWQAACKSSKSPRSTEGELYT